MPAANDDNNNDDDDDDDDNDDDPATTTNTVLALLLFVASTFAESLRRRWDLQVVPSVLLIVLVSLSPSSANLIIYAMGIFAFDPIFVHLIAVVFGDDPLPPT